MARMTTIETVTITRPLKVIAFICGIVVIILLIMALASADWLVASGWKQGLFMHCIEADAQQPLPFNIHDPAGCHQSKSTICAKMVVALCLTTLILDSIATLLIALGLKADKPTMKEKYYRYAMILMGVAFASIVIALFIYPINFVFELDFSNRTLWRFGWAYAVGWGSVLFLFGALVLLLCDKESEEIYYNQRRRVQYDNDGLV